MMNTGPPKGSLVPAYLYRVETWVQQILSGPISDQDGAAGTVRGKPLRRQLTGFSPAELLLQEELLKTRLNQTLELSPSEFADFQTAFIQTTRGISHATNIE